MFWSYLIFRILGIKDHAPDFRELFRFSIWLCTSKVTNEQPYKYSPVIRLCNMLSCNNIQITHMPNMLGITNFKPNTEAIIWGLHLGLKDISLPHF